MQVSHAHPLALFGLAALALSTGAQANDRHHRLPQLSPASPAALVGSCESLAARLAGLPQTTITSATTVPIHLPWRTTMHEPSLLLDAEAHFGTISGPRTSTRTRPMPGFPQAPGRAEPWRL